MKLRITNLQTTESIHKDYMLYNKQIANLPRNGHLIKNN